MPRVTVKQADIILNLLVRPPEGLEKKILLTGNFFTLLNHSMSVEMNRAGLEKSKM